MTASSDAQALEAPAPPRGPVVVIAGRPNVGKSTLVNRIVGRRAAVVDPQPGVTRDRKALDAEWNGVTFTLIDTGGWLGRGDELTAKVSGQAEKAIAEADVILMVADATVGATDEDLETARLLKRIGAPILLVANKVDDGGREAAAWELVALGLGDPWPVSALHGRGTGDLLDEVVRLLPAPDRPDAAEDDAEADGATDGATDVGTPRIALVGRPNAGKSTLFNRLVGEERSIVHDLPGTTRDAIDTVIETPVGRFCFVDTAGMRRPSRTDYGTEHHAVLRALDALDGADIALLVIDATVGATHQDQRLAERIGAAGCPSVVVLNKWDLVDAVERDDVLAGVGDRLAFLGQAPVLRVSAKSGRNVHKVLPAIQEAVVAYHTRIPTGALNRALRDLQARHPATGSRIRYGVQGAADPPTFTLFATNRLTQDYLRYIENQLRDRFDLGPTPIKLRVRLGGR
ncbi:MAG: ribosome biogenesis GTPase Der [Acidimicrobiales bacterium]